MGAALKVTCREDEDVDKRAADTHARTHNFARLLGIYPLCVDEGDSPRTHCLKTEVVPPDPETYVSVTLQKLSRPD